MSGGNRGERCDTVKTPAEPKVANYRDILIWQKGMQLAKAICALTKRFPAEEKFGLVSQMRRAAVSVPSNIAEGQVRRSTAEFVQFISHAEGSAAEMDTQLTLCVELGFCTEANVEGALGLISELKKMLNALRRNLTKAG